jgi:hypothetical protein
MEMISGNVWENVSTKFKERMRVIQSWDLRGLQ